MRKVLLCIPTLGTGGAEKFVVDLATKLDSTAFDVTVAVTRKNVSSIFERVLAEHNIPVVDLSGDSYFAMLRKQLLYLKRERPDVVHTNIGSVLHIMLATKLIPVPIKLFTMHNQAEYTLQARKINKLVYKMAFTFFGYTPVAICEHIVQSIEAGFGVDAKRIQKVNNGVDISNFMPALKDEKAHEVRIITTGRMDSNKNHNALIDAFSNIHKKNANVHLTILGDGVLREELEQKVAALGLTESVSMPGVQKNVFAYLQQADVYVSASRSEGLPLSILEAMACGLPVVATAAGGTVDIVKTGENGIVVPIDDEKALEEALGRMVEDAQLREKYGLSSLQIVQDWSIEACVKGYEKLYLGN